MVEFLDVSLDEAEKILGAARSVIEIRERSLQPAAEEGGESEAAGPDVADEPALRPPPNPRQKLPPPALNRRRTQLLKAMTKQSSAAFLTQPRKIFGLNTQPIRSLLPKPIQ